MSTTCGGVAQANLKNSTCAFNFRAVRNVIFTATSAEDGSTNGFATLAAMTKQAFLEKILETDRSKRYYFCEGGLFHEITDEFGDRLTQEYASGRIDTIKGGVRSFEGLKPELAPKMKGKIETHGSVAKLAVYLIDDNGNLGYVTDDSGLGVYPCPVNPGSLYVSPVLSTFEVNNGMNIGFNFDDSFKYENFQYTTIEDLDMLIDLYALNTVKATEVSNSLTELVVTLENEYGVPITGLLAANATMAKVSDGADIPITTLVETVATPGKYTFTVGAQSEAEVVQITWVNTAEGKEDYNDANEDTYILTA